VFALLGFIASFTLTLEKFEILRNPNAELACNINSVFNCSTVMKSVYADAYGVPLSLLGVAGYPATMLVGLLYIDRKKTGLILSYLVTLGPLGAFALSMYFMFVTAYFIGAFCPWCVLSAVSASVVFFSVLTIQIQEDNLKLPPKITHFLQEKIKMGWNIWFVVLFFIAALLFEWMPFYIASLR
jgi:uncharacterized membrane protein